MTNHGYPDLYPGEAAAIEAEDARRDARAEQQAEVDAALMRGRDKREQGGALSGGYYFPPTYVTPKHLFEEHQMLAEVIPVSGYHPVAEVTIKTADASQTIARSLRTALGLSHPGDPSEADHSRWRRSAVPRKTIDRKASLAIRHLADALGLPVDRLASVTITPTAIVADVIEEREDGQRAKRDGKQIETRRGAFYTYRPKTVTYTNGA